MRLAIFSIIIFVIVGAPLLYIVDIEAGILFLFLFLLFIFFIHVIFFLFCFSLSVQVNKSYSKELFKISFLLLFLKKKNSYRLSGRREAKSFGAVMSDGFSDREIEMQTVKLLGDEDVTNKSEIFDDTD